MTPTFLAARITATQEMIVAYEDAIAALTADPTMSYTIDTSQTKQTVTKQNLSGMQTSLDSLYNRLSTLESRAGSSSSQTTMRPGW